MNSKLSGKIKKPPVVEEIQNKPRTEEQITSVVKNVRNGDVTNPEVILIGEAELQRMKNNATDVWIILFYYQLEFRIFRYIIIIIKINITVSQRPKKNNYTRKNCLKNKKRSII